MNLRKILAIIILTAIFPWLFYKNLIGLNLLIYNILIIGGLGFVGKVNLQTVSSKIIIAGTIISAIMVVLNGSILAIAMNIISLALLAGISLFPRSTSVLFVGIYSLINFFFAQFSFFELLGEIPSGSRISLNVKRFIKIFILPVLVVILFMVIYKAANPVFEGVIKSFFDVIDQFYDFILEYLEMSLLFTTIFGLILTNYFFLGKALPDITEYEGKLSFNLEDKYQIEDTKRKERDEVEYRSAIVLFSLLNILILIINIIDINWVWLGFEWEGQYLKQFVHEGTYLLILSIIISLAISIFYFRGRLNFLSSNKPLRWLAYAWLLQNAILTISVGIRNFWYINYFSLAYLRIGVIFFLILTLFSIYTVYVKIRKKKSTYYLISVNSMATYIILVTMALFNWDTIIARYNFSHSKTAFIHYNFLSELSDNALPYLNKDMEELNQYEVDQERVFSYKGNYMSIHEYHMKIDSRTKEFIKKWPKRNIWEWTYAGERSYRKMKSRNLD